ncbi:UNVERIFIED_CONTAM: hypothetical protein Scaly_2935100 [Sesamum calycinum]|uniref:Uncharacterized protein n=1 Tax=Sesamum calycinum TaxID=2727403 RepID=A0AAW2KVV7_9LAMI
MSPEQSQYTYGARRFHISRSEWDRCFSRLTVVPVVQVHLTRNAFALARSSFAVPLRRLEVDSNLTVSLSSLDQSVSLSPVLVGEEGISIAKDSIQPQVPLRLPCYDFTPVEDPTVVCANKPPKAFVALV